MTAPRQTASYLMRRFREIGLRPASRHGQNFLIDLNLIDLLVTAAELDRQDVVLEIGTGTGSLTGKLAERAGHVVSVEIDEHLHQLASQTLAGSANVTLLHLDALRNKNHFHASILETVTAKLAATPGGRFKLAANLPYNIATPVISNLLLWPIVPDLLTVTIQKELADRMGAQPCTKDYSALSVWIQSLCSIELVRVLPPTVFWPQPKVHSAILKLTPQPDRRASIPDLPYFHGFVRRLFLHRRKFLRGVLAASCPFLARPQIDEILASLGHSSSSRAEELSPRQIFELSEQIRPLAAASISDK